MVYHIAGVELDHVSICLFFQPKIQKRLLKEWLLAHFLVAIFEETMAVSILNQKLFWVLNHPDRNPVGKRSYLFLKNGQARVTKPCWNYSPAEVIWVCPEPSVIPFWWLAERASHGGFCISHSLSNKWYRTTPTHCESAIIEFLEAHILTFEAHHFSSL